MRSEGGDKCSGDPSSALSKHAVGDFYFGPPVFEEVRIITSPVAPFFASSGYRCVVNAITIIIFI